MSRLPWIVGGGAVAAYLWGRTKPRGSSSALPGPAVLGALPGRWVWPVQAWKGRAPVISDGFDSPRPGLPRHGGVDLMFRRLPSDSFKDGTPNGSKLHVMPDGVGVLAAADGVVWSAMMTSHGHAVVIDHAPLKIATFYTHLDQLDVALTARAGTQQRVRAGQRIGTVGFSPLDPQKLKHLHFELWLGGPTDGVDPAPLLKTWPTVDDTREVFVARNASLTYRPLGARGEAYPQWVRDLKGRAGVYVIRDLETAEILYVGSSTTQLYDTLTRHFQTWRRWKGFWKGQYGEGHDPGLTYARDRVEVAVRTTNPRLALDEESRLIRRLKPRDNVIGQPVELEEAPF